MATARLEDQLAFNRPRTKTRSSLQQNSVQESGKNNRPSGESRIEVRAESPDRSNKHVRAASSRAWSFAWSLVCCYWWAICVWSYVVFVSDLPDLCSPHLALTRPPLPSYGNDNSRRKRSSRVAGRPFTPTESGDEESCRKKRRSRSAPFTRTLPQARPGGGRRARPTIPTGPGGGGYRSTSASTRRLARERPREHWRITISKKRSFGSVPFRFVRRGGWGATHMARSPAIVRWSSFFGGRWSRSVMFFFLRQLLRVISSTGKR